MCLTTWWDRRNSMGSSSPQPLLPFSPPQPIIIPFSPHPPSLSAGKFMHSVKLIHMTDLMSIWTKKYWSGYSSVGLLRRGREGLLWMQGTQSYRLGPVRKKGTGKFSISIPVSFWLQQYPLMSVLASLPRWKEPSKTTSQIKLSFLQLWISGKSLDVHIQRQLSGPCQPLLDAPWVSSSSVPIQQFTPCHTHLMPTLMSLSAACHSDSAPSSLCPVPRQLANNSSVSLCHHSCPHNGPTSHILAFYKWSSSLSIHLPSNYINYELTKS